MTGRVLVVGAGIAGVIAAIEAARNGASVTIACAGRLFGGSSFFPGTWGLGLIGPVDAPDEDDLISTILEVGGDVADSELVEAFVRGIRPAISWLEHDLGVTLKRPTSSQSAGEAAFIPCFDHKRRLWRGITRAEFTRAAAAEIRRLGITVLERHEIMGLLDERGEVLRGAANIPFRLRAGSQRVSGALLFNRAGGSLCSVAAEAVVLATGGTSGLFERSLTSADVLSSTHGIALDAGCEIINIEFMQMMPGLVKPKHGLVFNEKTFRYARLRDPSGILPHVGPALEELLETRSGHGPFTARLGDAAVDLAIDAAGPEGLSLTYAFPTHDVPEFVQTFASWLEREHGIAPNDELRIAMYAHASNGGIRISTQGETGVPGLFACGEVTGGMHGADRIGGLSSANGLVFGRRAGRFAAEFAAGNPHAEKPLQPEIPTRAPAALKPDALDGILPNGTPALDHIRAKELTNRLKHIMSRRAMINRTAESLDIALQELSALTLAAGDSRPAANATEEISRGASSPDIANALRLRSQLMLARAMITAMKTRTKSLGSHFRADAPDI